MAQRGMSVLGVVDSVISTNENEPKSNYFGGEYF